MLLSSALHPALAEKVTQRLENGIMAQADFYQSSETDMPAALILHGFMATHHFGTVQNIFNELRDQNYTVLAPTLSLGVPSRSTSLACDAIHTHHFDDDLREIQQWIGWLNQQGHNDIRLIGHSTGSLHLLAYASRNPSAHVTQLIATSLSYFGQIEPTVFAKQREKAKTRLHVGRKDLDHYSLAYCNNNFIAPADIYLSYSNWTRENVLNALIQAKLPITVVMGASDKRFKKDWRDAIVAAGGELQSIPGASHFFDAEHEFELLESITNLLERY